MASTGCSLTVDLDVTRLRAALKDKGYKFSPAYLRLVTKCLNEQPEFRLAEVDSWHVHRFLERLQEEMERFSE